MEFQVLGPFAVKSEGGQLPITPQQSIVLAVLILYANQIVSVDEIVDAVWGGEPPESAQHAVHVQVSRLRRLIDRPTGGEAIVTEHSGYRLRVPPESIDSIRFESLVESAAASTNPVETERLLEKALSLWCGHAYASFAYAGFADSEIRRLEELRLVAIEERGKAQLALGRHSELIPTLEALVLEFPFRERLWKQLMVSLYRSGRQADALLAYKQLRSNLGEELGIEPSAEIIDLEERILLQDPALAPAPLQVSAGNLPALPSSFVGRQQELAGLPDLIGGSRLVTLIGAAGVGKTRLALEAVAPLFDRFPGGIWFVDLADAITYEDAVRSTAATLDLGEEPGRTMTDQLGEYLGALPVLLILDNCEQVIEPVAHLTSTLLRGCPALHVLATSRELMRTEGEVAFPIEPLAFPETHSPLGDDDLRTFPAIELFLQRAEAASPGFRVEDKEALARLCAGLDGLPLALELAAARSRTLSVPEMLERIEDRFNLLSQGDRAGLGHHLTLEAAISWSYELLEDDERMLLDRLAVFSGFELDGAEQVCSDSNLEKASIADVLGRLVDKSLVQVEAVDHPRRRYRLLEAIRSFALARLRDSGLQARYQHRHAEFYLELADAFAEVAEAGGRAA